MLTLATVLALLPDWLDPQQIISRGGYLLIFGIIFAESGLLIGFFLPGDSLLFTAGMFAAGTFHETFPNVQFNIWVLLVGVFVAAVAGDQVGYVFGRKAGPALFSRPDSRFFKQEHLEKAQEFFERHGPRAIVLARFVPIVRTFCPIVAGAGHMEYKTFVRFNVVGGFLWGIGVTLLGYYLGNVSIIADHVELALLLVVAVSLIPISVEVLRSRRGKRAESTVG
ncbi:MAG: VTT domain-containing protein [Actinobacteria bacterium]|nr:VTT domain-containing protein [Actinomycetota bacterium]